MIYRNGNIPQNFNRIAEVNDNYIIWVKDSNLKYGVYYEAYYQFFTPFCSYLYTDKYRINTIDSYDAHYNNNGVYSYIDYYELNGEINTYSLVSGEDYTTCDLNYSRDYTNIIFLVFVITLLFLWIFKNISRLFFKGGLF